MDRRIWRFTLLNATNRFSKMWIDNCTTALPDHFFVQWPIRLFKRHVKVHWTILSVNWMNCLMSEKVWLLDCLWHNAGQGNVEVVASSLCGVQIHIKAWEYPPTLGCGLKSHPPFRFDMCEAGFSKLRVLKTKYSIDAQIEDNLSLYLS